MLEKIGLPAKPSQRGNNWVVDSSHCQGCSSQFTFINRKHHCRRCGGMFCNSCTQQRMVLRGQGDSPVRICDPCKKLEEAARFELRHGHRSRAARGSLKSTVKSQNEGLNQIPSNDRREAFASGLGSSSKMVSTVEGDSCLNTQEGSALDGEEVRRSSSIDEFSHLMSEKDTTSPEDLRQKALDEKKKYKVLKGEGKSDEALRAFKRGKELERQADALEIYLRKSRKKVLLSGNVEEVQSKDISRESRRRNTVAHLEGKDKDDLAAELKELGWSDMDLHNVEKKGTNLTLEGELSSLLGEMSEKTEKRKDTNYIDRTQVVAHKKKALALKREGKLAEAKEELRKAKVLEKQLEEQEFLAEADDSDDELLALIHSMDSDEQELFSNLHEQEHGFDFGSLVDAADDQIIDGNFDVTDEDMEDPAIAADLKSVGWIDNSDNPESVVPQIVSVDKETLLDEILSLKREAVNQKRAGNISEAMTLLKKAKLFERDLESSESQEGKVTKDPTRVRKDLTIQASNKSFKVSDENVNAMKDIDSKLAPKSKLMIQKELLGLKKKALTLRREGRLDEAEEELKKGKILEHQLEEMEKASIHTKDPSSVHDHSNFSNDFPIEDEKGEDVSDQDMYDPTYLSILRNLGWKDEESDVPNFSTVSHGRNDNLLGQISVSSIPQAAPIVPFEGSRRSRAEIQRELLGLKRKALSLRRQGESEEAEEVLRMAKALETQMVEMEPPTKQVQLDLSTHKENIVKSPPESVDKEGDTGIVKEKDMHEPTVLLMLKNLGRNGEVKETVIMHEKQKENAFNSIVHSENTSLHQTFPMIVVSPQKSKGEIQRELLNLKRKALALRRKGETEEAEELLKMAKVLEAQMEELEAPKQVHLHEASNDEKPQNFGSLMNQEKQGNLMNDVETSRGTSHATSGSSDKFVEKSIDLLTGDDWRDSQIFAKKQTDGFNYCSDGSLLGSSAIQVSTLTSSEGVMSRKDDVKREKKEDIVLSEEKPLAYESIFINEHTSMSRKNDVESKRQENVVYEANSTEENASQTNDVALKQDILARKRKAVALKRKGKLVEAREELRQAKLLEKHLEKNNAESKTDPAYESVPASSVSSSIGGQKEHGGSSNIAAKPISGRDRFKLQQESLAYKRQALKLRREGRTEEAEAEFEKAKALETQLEELSATDSSNSTVNGANDVGVEDFLDPQLLSALKAIGIEDANTVAQVPDRPQPSKPTVAKNENYNKERNQVEEQIKAEKVKALNLKRSGKQAEAMDALRKAKFLEKKLKTLA